MKKIFIDKENDFWTNNRIVNYFSTMPADPFIINRLSLIRDKFKKKALDLGCGGGRHTEMLVKMGFQTYACDVSDKMIASTKKRIVKKFSLLNINLNIKFGSMSNIPFTSRIFDIIVATGVLHQAKSLLEYEQTIKEVARVSKQGCILYLDIFTNKNWDQTYTKMDNEEYTVITKEGLYMTILPKEIFYQFIEKYGFKLFEEVPEKNILENTGPRTILKTIFIKTDN